MEKLNLQLHFILEKVLLFGKDYKKCSMKYEFQYLTFYDSDVIMEKITYRQNKDFLPKGLQKD